MSVPKTITARRRLELSQVSPAAVQREAMGTDVDFDKFSLYLSSQIQTDLAGRITAATITRTIEGASTLSVDINDWDRRVLRSGLLAQRLDVQIDGLWFRMTVVDKSGDDLTLTFQDREVEILRTYNKWRIAQRGQMTRAEFVYSMLREVKEIEFRLGKNVVIPELHTVQPIEKYQGDIMGTDTVIQKVKGIPSDVNRVSRESHNHGRDTPGQSFLTVKGDPATADQIKNANIILAVGDDVGVSRRLKVVAIMTAITESKLINDPGGDADSAGIFQQRPGWGSYTDRTNVETSARLFYKAAIPVEKAHDSDPYWLIAADTQHPAIQYQTRYSLWRTEAEKFVNAYGDLGTTTSDANAMHTQTQAFTASNGAFYFYRGKITDKRGLKIRKPENTWSCTQRLSDEVDWRSFFVSGTYYFISEDDLFKQLPLATLQEFDEGVISLDGNYDNHKRSAAITLDVEVGRWQIPPGAVVVLANAGPFSGRWLVNDYTRDLIGDNRVAQVTLKKPRPKLPEPLASNATDISTSWVPQAANSGLLPPTKDLKSLVLNDKNITFSNNLETSDIQFDKIDERVLQALEFLTGRGYQITITALRSDHSANTTEGRVSAHSVGKAVDIGAISGVLCSNNDMTSQVVDLLTLYQPQLGFDQLICPFPLKCIPRGLYDAPTLAQHRNHIHLGWPI